MRVRVKLVVGLVAVLAISAHGQSWTTAQLLNQPSETTADIKSPRIAASVSGGFYAYYRVFGQAPHPQMKSRRYLNGTLGPAVMVFENNFNANGNIVETGDGVVHIAFENWVDGPYVGWTRSTDGGGSWSPVLNISTSSDAKHPQIAQIGLGSSAQLLMSFWNADNHHIYHNKYNGSTWGGQTDTGRTGGSEYEVTGICTSQADGTVWRSHDDGDWIAASRFNGTSWDATHNVANIGFFAWQSVAANAAGQIMLVWDKDETTWYSIYNPGSGWSSKQVIWTDAFRGNVVVIPGTNDFYVVDNVSGTVRGRRWTGFWNAEELISVGQGAAQTEDPRVAIGPDGAMYCVWEYWGTGKPQAWYSTRGAPPPTPKGTLSGYVRNQYGVGIPGASVNVGGVAATTSGAGGAYSVQVTEGTYTVNATKSFFSTHTVTGVAIQQNQTTQQDFSIEGYPPLPVQSLTVQASSTRNELVWKNAAVSNVSGSVVRVSTTAPPASATDGSLVVDVAGGPNSEHYFDHGGLTNGVTYYYTAFSYFQDASKYYSDGVSGAGTPGVGPDFDSDGDVDLEDFAIMQRCLSGAFQPYEIGCERPNFDGDVDVDTEDMAVFVNCFSGPGVPAPPGCSTE